MAAQWHEVADETTAKTRHKTWRCGGCRRLAVTGALVTAWNPGATPPAMTSPCTFCEVR